MGVVRSLDLCNMLWHIIESCQVIKFENHLGVEVILRLNSCILILNILSDVLVLMLGVTLSSASGLI